MKGNKSQGRLIIGIVGEKGSGKDTVANYLEKKYGAKNISFAQPLNDILRRLHLQKNRSNQINLFLGLQQAFGSDILIRTLMVDAKKYQHKILVFSNIRRWPEYEVLKKMKKIILWYVTADAKIRYQRTKLRKEKSGENRFTFRQFMAEHKKPTEIYIPKIAKKTNFTITNNSTRLELYQEINKIFNQVRS